MHTKVPLSHREQMIEHQERSERIADERILKSLKNKHRLNEQQARALEAKLRKAGVIE